MARHSAGTASPSMLYLASGNNALVRAALTASFAVTFLLLPLLLTVLASVASFS